jgi:hypothetical protein
VVREKNERKKVRAIMYDGGEGEVFARNPLAVVYGWISLQTMLLADFG